VNESSNEDVTGVNDKEEDTMKAKHIQILHHHVCVQNL